MATQQSSATMPRVQVRPAAPPVGRRLRGLIETRPAMIRLSGALVVLATLLFGLVCGADYLDLRQAVQTVGRDSEPSIVAAEHIRATLADAHGAAVNAFLTGEADAGANWTSYRRDMDDVHNSLVEAAENITYGDEERQPILTVMTGIGQYERLVGQARGHARPEAKADLDAADTLMSSTILPAASALDQANFQHLTATYDSHRQRFFEARAVTVVLGLLTLAALGWSQFYLAARTRRLLNAGLLAAAVVLAGFTIYSLSALSATEAALRLAKQDAFDSVHALWKARAVAYEANTDESLLLYDRGDKAVQDNRTTVFTKQAQAIAAGDIDQDLQEAAANRKFGGFLGDELANITFPGERDAALATLGAWARYLRIDGQIRLLDAQTRAADALALHIGAKPEQASGAFLQFDQALGKTLDINQREFDRAIDQAFALLTPYPYALAGALLLIILATLAGLKPRLDEYRF